MIALLLIAISIIDIFSHRIPNRLLLILVALALHENSVTFNLLGGFWAIFLGAVGLFFTEIGAGDIKLFFILALLVVPDGQMLRYLSGISIATLLLITVHYVVERSFSGRIAFAPALCGAVLATSLY
jgi:Flp pilus assembly protein protease CpaA